MNIDFFTLGVYGLTSEQFFNKISSNNIDTFIDIRRRRAVRGSEYTFVNSNRLQIKLKESGISYIHVPELSPDDELRKIQLVSDKLKNITIRSRNSLDPIFISEYKKNVLDNYNFDDFFEQLSRLKTKKAVLFCVESEAHACHRSIVAEKLENEYSARIIHL